MFCPKCGTENDDNAVFCVNCGNRLSPEEKSTGSIGELAGSFDEEEDDAEKAESDPEYEDAGQSASADQMDADTEEEDDYEDVFAEDDEYDSGERPHSRVHPLTKVIIVEAMVLLLVLAGVFIMQKMFYSPESVTRSFLKAQVSNDYNKMYSLISWPEDKAGMLSRKEFVTAMGMRGEDDGESSNLTIISCRKADDSESSGKQKTMKIIYQLGDDSDTSSKFVVVRKNGRWYVKENGMYVAKDMKIVVPEGSKLLLNEKAVPDKVKKSTQKGSDTYTFDHMFKGYYLAQVSRKDMKESAEFIDPTTEREKISLEYNDDVFETVSKQAMKDLQDILNAAAKGQNAAQVSAVKGVDKQFKENALNEYNAIRQNVTYTAAQDDTHLFDSLMLTDNTASASNETQDDGTQTITVAVNSAYEYNWETLSYWDGTGMPNRQTGRTDNTFTYKQDGDKWALYSMDLQTWYGY